MICAIIDFWVLMLMIHLGPTSISFQKERSTTKLEERTSARRGPQSLLVHFADVNVFMLRNFVLPAIQYPSTASLRKIILSLSPSNQLLLQKYREVLLGHPDPRSISSFVATESILASRASFCAFRAASLFPLTI